MKATNKWMAKAYDRVNLTMPKGKKEIVQAHAEDIGTSVNGFINRAIDEAMARDKRAQAAPDGPSGVWGKEVRECEYAGKLSADRSAAKRGMDVG